MSKRASDLNYTQMFQSNSTYQTHLNQFGLKSALLVLLLICSTISFGQGWELKVGGSKEDQARVVIPTVDQGNLVIGFSESYGTDNDIDILAIRTDVDGSIIWQKVFDESFTEQPNAVIELEDGSFLIAGLIKNGFNAPNNVYLLKISREGRELWSKTYSAIVNEIAFGITSTPDDGFIVVGTTEDPASGTDDILVMKVDENGNEIWRNAFGAFEKEDVGKRILSVSDGYIVAANVKENVGTGNNVALYKLDEQGEFVWSKFYGETGVNDEVNDLLLTQNDEIVLVGSADDFNRALIAKFDLNGDTLWYREIDAAPFDDLLNAVVEVPDGSLVAVGVTFPNAAYSKILMLKVSGEGESVWEKEVGDENAINFGEDLALSADGGFVIAGHSTESLNPINIINDVVLTKVDGSGQYPSNTLTGQVNHLLDGCGGVDASPLEEWLVQVVGEEITYYGTTDENGYYDISVDPGTYTVSLLKPNNHWGICNPLAFVAEFREFYDTTITNFTTFTAEDCPFMGVDVSVPIIVNNLVQCEDAAYTVNYCNRGPVTAENAYVKVALDKELRFVASTITPADVNPEENQWTFNLGDIGSMECGSFMVTVSRDCEGLTDGQALVVSAEIFPNEICTEPDPSWDRSSLEVAARCDIDTITFKVRNIGEAPMNVPSEYIVIQDDVIFRQGPIPTLEPDEEIPFKFETTGATYRMIARQSEGNPGNSLPTVAIEGCANEDIITSVGYYSDLPENDRDANIDIDVQEVISPEKTTHLKGHPNGYKDFILDQETDIEYTIIFSNVWTDTIDRVVIRDTISPFLDIFSVEPGASSHPYDFEIYNHGIVKFTLSEIQLQPVGSAEEASSMGFVKFRISQKPQNPVGTEITNSAAVYFDYHAPETTNVVNYVIGCTDFLQGGCLEFVPNGVTENFPGVKINIAPNPFFDKATIDIEGITLKEAELRVYDMTGRLLRTNKARANTFEVYRNNLPGGMYTFQILTDGQTLATGKLVAR